ncbi:MAG: hypothetical protein DRI99_02095 [Candidatus Aminicenantes bacterium]|nr:MAG: hypothetical protein DRI99_02095 [Candidatus Aminicenantes bacterium]
MDENPYWDSQEAEPIFILGKEDIKLQKQIELIKQKITNLNDEKRRRKMNTLG